MISVLLVDDEPPALDSGKRYLETKGHYKVSTTLSPRTALEMLKNGHYDIIISDYNMPDMDGIGFLKEVRAAYPTLPFILYTNKSRTDIGGEAFDNEADFYLQRTGNPILVMEELTQKIQIIVERRSMQEAIRASEEKFRQLFSWMPSGVAIYEAVNNGEDFVFRDFNTAGEAIEHVRKEEVIGKRVTEVFPGVKEFDIFSVFQRVWRTGKPEFFPMAVYQDGRSPGTWRDSWTYKLPTGEIVSIYNDVTDRKRAEEKLRSHQTELTMQNEEMLTIQKDLQVSRDQYIDLYDMAPVGYLTISTQGLVLKANLTAATLLNVEQRKLVKAPVSRFIVTSDQNTYYQHLKQLADTNQQQSFELKIRRQGGSSPIWAHIIMDLVEAGEGDTAACNLIILDITDRKRAEVALRESEERFRLTFELATIGKSLTAIDGKLIKVNRAFCEMLGYTAQELQDKGFTEVTHPDDVAKSKESVRTLLSGKLPMYRFLKRYIRKDGAIVWADVSTMLLRDPAGKPLTFVTHIMDITERKKAEDTLRQVHEQLIKSEELLKETGRMALVGGWEIDVATLQQVWTDEVYRIHEVEPGIMPTVEEGIGFYAPEARPVIAEAVRRSIAVGDPFDLELAFITAKGNRRWVRANGKALREAGKTVKVLGTFQDITDRKRATQEIARIAREWETTFNATSDGICLMDADQKIQRCNNRMSEMLGGMRHEDLVGKPCWAIIHKTTGPIPACPFVSAKTSLKRTQVEIPAGDLWFEVTADPVFDSSGTFAGAVHIMRDVTERKRVEEALQKSERRYRNLFNSSHDAMMTLEPPSWRFTSCNLSAVQMFMARDEAGFTSKEPWTLSPDQQPDGRDSGDKAKEMIETAMRTGTHYFEWTHTRLNGENFPATVLLSKTELAGKVFLQATVRDITEQKRAEVALRESEEKYRMLFDNMLDGFAYCQMIYDGDGHPQDFIYLSVNDAFDRITGTKTVTMKRVTEVYPGIKEAFPELFLIYGRVALTGTPESFEINFKPIAKWLHISVYSPQKEYFAAVFEDITTRKWVEEALRQSEERFRAIFNSASDAIHIHEIGSDFTPGKFLDVNDVACRMLKMSHEEILNHSPRDIATEHHNPPLPEILRLFATKGNAIFETGHRRSDGVIVPVEINSHIINLQGKTVMLGIIRDITERKRAEEALQRANKQLNLLSSITRHDILNQLMALKGYLYLSHEVIDNPTTLIEYIKKEEQAANTIEHQITFTKDYQDLGAAAPAWQNVNANINKALFGLPMRDVHVEVDPANPELFADPLFEKVFYNLIDNALRYGGDKMKTIRVSSQENDTGLLIVCEDDGVGISEEEKKRLFTRGFGKNSCLGLFLSREILSITGITITENGTPGKGARFEITVPKGAYRFTATWGK